MGYGKMEGEHSDKNIAYMIERDEAQGPVYFQKWYGMKPTTPIISGGMNALRLPGFFENLGHGNVINTSAAALTATSTARLLVRSLCVSHTSAGKLKLTLSNSRSHIKNLLAHLNRSQATLTSCIQAGDRSWAHISKLSFISAEH